MINSNIILTTNDLNDVVDWLQKYQIKVDANNITKCLSNGYWIGQVVNSQLNSKNVSCSLSNKNDKDTKRRNWMIINKILFDSINLTISHLLLNDIVNSQKMSIEKFVDQYQKYFFCYSLKRDEFAFQDSSGCLCKNDLRNKKKLISKMDANQNQLRISNLQESIMMLGNKLTKMQRMMELKDKKIYILEKTLNRIDKC